MRNNIEDFHEQITDCTSCQMCFAVCPTKAITIELNKEGFYRPIVNKEKCISCGKCKNSCYKFDKNIVMSNVNIAAYAAKSKSQKILGNSTSGGVSTHIAETLIEQGYKIVGVTYNYKRNRAENIIIDNSNDLYKIQGSKYIQSYSAEVFEKVISDFSYDLDEKYAIFGLPCQIYAIDKYLQQINRRENFILIDLFCHGCPSMFLWNKYLQDIIMKNNLDEIKKIEFRSKIKGWHEFIVTIRDKNGKIFISENELSPFFRLFFSDKILNKSCYNCKLRSTLEYTDIRIGDYWGKKYDLDSEGVSAVVLVTNKGKDMFDKIKEKIHIEGATLTDIIKNQSYGKEYEINLDFRNELLSMLKESEDIDTFLKKYHKTLSYKEKTKYFIKKVYYLFPSKIRLLLKKYYHS